MHSETQEIQGILAASWLAGSVLPTMADEVTTEWLATLLPGARAESVKRVGAAHGFSSTILRVRGTAPDGDIDLAMKLGAVDQLAPEIWFYERCAAATPIDLAAFRFAAADPTTDRAALAIDHLAGVEQGDSLDGAPDRVLHDLARVLARLHHRWPGEAPELDEIRHRPRPRWAVKDGRAEAMLERFALDLGPGAADALQRLTEAAPASNDIVGEGPTTLVHGDVHLDNVLIGGDGTVFLLDWEGVRMGTPAEDLAGLVLEQPDRTRWDDLLATYLDEADRLGSAADPHLRRRVDVAVIGRRAGQVNWLGRADLGESGGRRHELARRTARELVQHLDGGL